MTDYKLVPSEATLEMGWAYLEAAEKGDPDTRHTFNHQGYRAMLAAAPDVQEEQVEFCEDAAISLAERTFSTEVDEQLASDITQYARRLHTLYTAPQPTSKEVSDGCF